MEITPQIIQDVEDGKVEGIRLVEKKGRTIYLVDCVLSNGDKVQREVGFLGSYNRFIKTGLSEGEATLQAKTKALQKCFKLKVEGVLEKENLNINPLTAEELCNILDFGDGTINGITIEKDDNKYKNVDPYGFRLRIKINGKNFSNAVKIISKNGDFNSNFYSIILMLCQLYGLPEVETKKASEMLYDKYLKYYEDYYLSIRDLSGASLAA